MPIILFLSNFVFWIILTGYLLTNYQNLDLWIIFLGICGLTLSYHYFFNLLHICSHFAISRPTLSDFVTICQALFRNLIRLSQAKPKNSSSIISNPDPKSQNSKKTLRGTSFQLNTVIGTVCAVFGGMTFYSFQKTHLKHHQYYLRRDLLEYPEQLKEQLYNSDRSADNQPNDKKNTSSNLEDPDKKLLVYGPFITPFLIFSHDFSFFALRPKMSEILNYTFSRIFQVGLMIWLLNEYPLEVIIRTILLPLLIVGYLNSFFLFYFPHYTPKWERILRQKLQS